MDEKVWSGSKISKCDLCYDAIENEFIDGHLRLGGPWGIFCPRCFAIGGVGFGTGRGQRYMKQDDGRFLKVEG